MNPTQTPPMFACLRVSGESETLRIKRMNGGCYTALMEHPALEDLTWHRRGAVVVAEGESEVERAG